jgi:hypothetical protein
MPSSMGCLGAFFLFSRDTYDFLRMEDETKEK